jgi:hypothetical protein
MIHSSQRNLYYLRPFPRAFPLSHNQAYLASPLRTQASTVTKKQKVKASEPHITNKQTTRSRRQYGNYTLTLKKPCVAKSSKHTQNVAAAMTPSLCATKTSRRRRRSSSSKIRRNTTSTVGASRARKSSEKDAADVVLRVVQDFNLIDLGRGRREGRW